MSSLPFEIWANNRTAGNGLKAPTVAAQGEGFTCGPADPEIFNQLFHWLTTEAQNSCTRLDALETNDLSDDAQVATLVATVNQNVSDISALQTLANSNESRVAANESSVASQATSIGSLNASILSHNTRLTNIENDYWNSGNDGNGSGLDADLLGGVANAEYYHSQKANQYIRMGTTGADFDGIFFDDSSNTFTFKADAAAQVNDGTGTSVLNAYRLSLTSTSDASPSSTSHAFEIASFTAGDYMRMDANEIAYKVGVDEGSLFFKDVAQKTDKVTRFEGDNVALAGSETIQAGWNNGGSGAAVFEVEKIEAYRVFDLLHISLRIEFNNLNVSPDGDDTFDIAFDNYVDFLVRQGLCTSIARTTTAIAVAKLTGTATDFQEIVMTATAGTTDLTLVNRDRAGQGVTTPNITGAVVDVSFTIRVNG